MNYFQETRSESREWDGVTAMLDSATANAANLIDFLRAELDNARAQVEDLEGKVESLTEDLNYYRNKYE